LVQLSLLAFQFKYFKMSYKAIIIDDELRARTLMQGMIETFVTDIEVVALCEDLPNGVKAIHKLKPDLVFLDIEMPGHSGLELLDFFNEDEVNFGIIFTTAYNQYAVKAFKLSAIDYLLKPIEEEELIAAVERFKKQTKKTKVDYSAFKENLNQPTMNKIAVPTGNTIQFIELNTIHYLKASSSYTEIFFTDDTRLVVSRILKNFEEILNEETQFFRCHKSYIVNTKYITGLIKSDGGHLSLLNDVTVPISSDKSVELMNLMKIIKR
jgi:two-component system LytT family response regulator